MSRIILEFGNVGTEQGLPVAGAGEIGDNRGRKDRQREFGQVPGHAYNDAIPIESGLVAESTQPSGSSPTLTSFQSDGRVLRLCKGVQEAGPGCRYQGPACFDDGLSGLVAGRLWPLRTIIHSYGLA